MGGTVIDVPEIYMCRKCWFIYDSSLGLLEDGVLAGTRFSEIPENWVCPDCGAGKEFFQLHDQCVQ
jgi:rubredoxin